VIYREAGQFKTSYGSDQAVFPIVQDRVLVGLGLLAAVLVPPLVANEYWLQAILIPFLIYALAAIGLPPFGVYSGFMGLLLTPALPLSGALVVIIGTMLAACWYFLGLTQQLLFGPHRPDLRYEDLCFTEAAALVMIVVLLMALGIVPPRFLESSKPMSQAQSKEFLAWNR